jgi:hypothetical protein
LLKVQIEAFVSREASSLPNFVTTVGCIAELILSLMVCDLVVGFFVKVGLREGSIERSIWGRRDIRRWGGKEEQLQDYQALGKKLKLERRHLQLKTLVQNPTKRRSRRSWLQIWTLQRSSG